MMKHIYLNSLIYSTIIIIFISIFPLKSQATCITSEPGDSSSFGESLALNDEYLAVGDPEANRVVLYTPNKKGKWVRTREIKPPPNSRTERVGSGFGSALSLDQSTLVIGAYTQKDKPTNLDAFQSTNLLGISFAGGVYKVQLDQLNPEVESLDALVPLIEGEITGMSVIVSRGNIAFNAWRSERGILISKVYLIRDGEVKEILPPADSEEQLFGIALKLNKNWLLVGSRFFNAGGGWLFDLNNLEKPEKLVVNNAYLGNVLALSDDFAVIGALGPGTGEPKTLIKSLKDGSITVIDGGGLLSLEGNILAIMRPASPLADYDAVSEVFYLSIPNGPFRLAVHTSINIKNDFYLLADGFLVTQKETARGIRLCIEQKST